MDNLNPDNLFGDIVGSSDKLDPNNLFGDIVPQPEAPKPKQPSFVDTLKQGGASVLQGINEGVASLASKPAHMVDILSEKTGMGKGGVFNNIEKWGKEGAEYWKKDALPEDSMAGMVARGLGSAPAGVAEFAAGPGYAGLTGAAEAYRKGDNPVVGAAKGAAERYLLGKVFHGIDALNVVRPVKGLLQAGVMGGQTAIEGGSPKDIIASAITGGMLVLPDHISAVRKSNKFVDDIAGRLERNEPVHPDEVEYLQKIAKGGLGSNAKKRAKGLFDGVQPEDNLYPMPEAGIHNGADLDTGMEQVLNEPKQIGYDGTIQHQLTVPRQTADGSLPTTAIDGEVVQQQQRGIAGLLTGPVIEGEVIPQRQIPYKGIITGESLDAEMTAALNPKGENHTEATTTQGNEAGAAERNRATGQTGNLPEEVVPDKSGLMQQGGDAPVSLTPASKIADALNKIDTTGMTADDIEVATAPITKTPEFDATVQEVMDKTGNDYQNSLDYVSIELRNHLHDKAGIPRLEQGEAKSAKEFRESFVNTLNEIKEIGQEGKQPWEMTKKEYFAPTRNGLGPSLASQEAGRSMIGMQDEIRANMAHRGHVVTALSEGKPVPANVLAEYPELQPKTETNPASGAILPDSPLTPAVRLKDGTVHAADTIGQRHDDIIKREKLGANKAKEKTRERGFLDAEGNWLDRKQSSEYMRSQGHEVPDELHSEDLWEALKGKEEPATPAEVVQEAVDTAKQEGVSLKDQKKFLLENLDDAIQKAPEHGSDTVTIRIPNDGTFELANDKAKLEKFRKKVVSQWGKDPKNNAEATTDISLVNKGFDQALEIYGNAKTAVEKMQAAVASGAYEFENKTQERIFIKTIEQLQKRAKIDKWNQPKQPEPATVEQSPQPEPQKPAVDIPSNWKRNETASGTQYVNSVGETATPTKDGKWQIKDTFNGKEIVETEAEAIEILKENEDVNYSLKKDRRTFDERVRIPEYFRNYLAGRHGTTSDVLRHAGIPITAEEANALRKAGAGENIYDATAGSDVAPIELKYPSRYKPTYSASLGKYLLPEGIPDKFNLNKYEATAFKDRILDSFKQSETSPYYSLGEKNDSQTTRLRSSFEDARKVLSRFGLADEVALKHVESLAGGRAEGSQLGNVIKIAMTADDPVGVLHHEAIHYLKEVGAISKENWNTLTAKSTEWLRSHANKEELLKRYDEYRKMGRTNEQITEERIADMFREYGDGKRTQGAVARIMAKVREFFKGISDAFTANGYRTAEEVMRDITEGKNATARETTTDRGNDNRLRRVPVDNAPADAKDTSPLLSIHKGGVGRDILALQKAAESAAAQTGQKIPQDAYKVATDEGSQRLRSHSGIEEKYSISPSDKDLEQARQDYAKVESKYFHPDGTEKPGAMLAPNGKRSDLNKQQWIDVRTQAFKKKFGDWEAVAKATMPRKAATLGQAKDKAADFAGSQIENISTGLVATVSNTNLSKMTSQAATSKSSSIADHALAIANIDQLFRNALLDHSHADKNGEPTITSIHRYVAPMINADGKVVAVKMTVKETLGEKQPNPIYTVETLEIIKPTLDAPQGGIERATDLRNTPQVGFNDIVTKALHDVNPSSVFVKVFDANGEPIAASVIDMNPDIQLPHLEILTKLKEHPSVKESLDWLGDLVNLPNKLMKESRDAFGKMTGARNKADDQLKVMQHELENSPEVKKITRKYAGLKNYFDTLTPEKLAAYHDAVRSGDFSKLSTAEKEMAAFGAKLEEQYNQILLAFDPSFPIKENHGMMTVRWMFEGQDKPMGSIVSSLQGDNSFTKKRSDRSVSEMIASGMKADLNPVNLIRKAVSDRAKYVSTGIMSQNGIASGTWQYVPKGGSKPEGFAKLPDIIAKVHKKILYPGGANPVTVKSYDVMNADGEVLRSFPYKAMAKSFAKENKGTIEPRIGKPQFAHAGDWYVPEKEAIALERYLQSDPLHKNPITSAMLGVKGLYTSTELLGLFHYATTTEEATRDWSANVLRLAVAGDMEGAKKAFSENKVYGIKPLAEKWLKDADAFGKDKEVAAELKRMGLDAQEFGEVMNHLYEGGFKMEREDYKSTISKWLDSKAGNPVADMARLSRDSLGTLQNHLFHKFVPELKLAAAINDFRTSKRQYADRLASGEMDIKELARRTVRSVDNRFGEMNYETLMIPKALKSAMQLVFRAPGWNIGTWREMPNAFRTQGQEIRRAINKGEKPLLTQEMSWLVTTVATHIAEAALIGYGAAAITGDDKLKPSEWNDFFFPKISAMTRIVPPGYLKDVFSMYHDSVQGPFYMPVNFLQSKLAGHWGRMAEIFRNRDYYGNQVRNPEDNLAMQAVDVARHMVPIPLFYRSIQAEAKSADNNWATKLASFIGFNKAPAWIEKSDAQNLIDEINAKHSGDAAFTPQQAKERAAKKEVLALLRKGKGIADIPKEHMETLQKMSVDKQDQILKEAQQSPLQAGFQKLNNVDDAIKVWKKMRPEEKRLNADAFVKKVDNALNRLENNPEEAQSLYNRVAPLLKGLNTYVAPEQPDVHPDLQERGRNRQAILEDDDDE